MESETRLALAGVTFSIIAAISASGYQAYHREKLGTMLVVCTAASSAQQLALDLAVHAVTGHSEANPAPGKSVVVCDPQELWRQGIRSDLVLEWEKTRYPVMVYWLATLLGGWSLVVLQRGNKKPR